MKPRMKFLIASLLISASLFSGGDDEYKHKEMIKKYLKNIEVEEILDNLDIKILRSLVEKTRFNENELLEHYDEATRKEIRKMAIYFAIPPEWVYQLFYKECRLNPSATNKLTNAQGIIQFMPSTAKNLDISVEELSTMTVIEQLPYVQEYLERINPSKKFESFTDLYLAVFFPKAIGKSDTYVIGSHRGEEYIETVAKQNEGIDKNKNNSITVGEFAQYANRC